MMYKKLYTTLYYELRILDMFIDILDKLPIEKKIKLFSKYGDDMKEFYLSNLEERNELPDEYKIDSRARVITFPTTVFGNQIVIKVPVVWNEDKINNYLKQRYNSIYEYKDRIKEEIVD